MMSSVKRCSSTQPRGTLHSVDRCGPRARQARRSDTPRSRRTSSIHSRRREGLRSFPLPSRSRWVCPASDQTPHAAAVGSLSHALSAGQAVIAECRHRVYATCRASAMSRRSGAQPPRLSRLDPAELQHAEASIRYLPAIADLPF